MEDLILSEFGTKYYEMVSCLGGDSGENDSALRVFGIVGEVLEDSSGKA